MRVVKDWVTHLYNIDQLMEVRREACVCVCGGYMH